MTSLTLVRRIAARPAIVFDALTRSALHSAWVAATAPVPGYGTAVQPSASCDLTPAAWAAWPSSHGPNVFTSRKNAPTPTSLPMKKATKNF